MTMICFPIHRLVWCGAFWPENNIVLLLSCLPFNLSIYYNSGVTGGGGVVRVPPQRRLTREFLLTYRENRAEKKENRKWRWKIKNGRRKSYKMRRGFFSFFLSFFFFFLFTFQNHWTLFWAYQNGNFYREKSFYSGEKIRKNEFAPSEKYYSYAPVLDLWEKKKKQKQKKKTQNKTKKKKKKKKNT